MERRAQRGSALVETAVALAILAIVGGAALNAVIATSRFANGRPVRETLAAEVRREMPVAIDLVKYAGANVPPATVTTALPMPTGTPLAANVTLAVSPAPDGSLRVGITAVQRDAPHDRAALTATLGAQAPQPGATILAPGLVPAPTGAP